jgi:hypothetical protein
MWFPAAPSLVLVRPTRSDLGEQLAYLVSRPGRFTRNVLDVVRHGRGDVFVPEKTFGREHGLFPCGDRAETAPQRVPALPKFSEGFIKFKFVLRLRMLCFGLIANSASPKRGTHHARG